MELLSLLVLLVLSLSVSSGGVWVLAGVGSLGLVGTGRIVRGIFGFAAGVAGTGSLFLRIERMRGASLLGLIVSVAASLLLDPMLLISLLSLTAESARCSLLVCERVERRRGCVSDLAGAVTSGSASALAHGCTAAAGCRELTIWKSTPATVRMLDLIGDGSAASSSASFFNNGVSSSWKSSVNDVVLPGDFVACSPGTGEDAAFMPGARTL